MCGTPFLSRLVISKKFIILDWIGLLYLVLLLRANVVNTVNMHCALMALNVKYNVPVYLFNTLTKNNQNCNKMHKENLKN